PCARRLRLSALTRSTETLTGAGFPGSGPTGWRRRAARVASGRHERGGQVFDVGLELFLRHPRLVQLQVELEEADVGRVGQAGAGVGAGWGGTDGDWMSAPICGVEGGARWQLGVGGGGGGWRRGAGGGWGAWDRPCTGRCRRDGRGDGHETIQGKLHARFENI